ncbi:hypothetical protein [Streptomyces sp. NPDC052693]|uniref:hypothetical protein n=1 Tax=Streptomyces sp. NPDC052693 TaxID=3155814 RepID=UPI00343905B9
MESSGGSSETLVKELASMASSWPSTSAAISASPVGQAAKVRRTSASGGVCVELLFWCAMDIMSGPRGTV